MRKTYLLFVLLLSLMGGVNVAFADTVTDDFTSYTATSSGQTLGDNWYVYPGEDGSYGRFGSDYTYKNNTYDGADYNFVSGYKSNYDKNVWLVLKKQVSGTVSFRSRMSNSTGSIYVTNKVTAVGDGTFTVDKTGAQSYSISSTASSNEYQAGDAATYVAFCLTSDYMRLLDVTYTEYEESDGPALKVSGDDAGALNFGMVSAGATKSLTLSNPGSESITVGIEATGGFGVDNSQLTIAAGKQATLTVSTPDATASGTLTITPKPAVEGIDPVVIALSCVVKDPNKLFVNFADGLPVDWTANSWSVSTTGGGNGSSGGGYAVQETSVFTKYRMVTDKITFADNEPLLFLAAAEEYYGSVSSYTGLEVQYSEDGSTWKTVGTITASDLLETWKTFTFNMPAGSYYVGFYGAYTYITDIYGGEQPKVARLSVTGTDHNFGFIDSEASTTYNVKNIGTAELTGISVTVDNAAFAVSGAPETLAAGADADVAVALAADVKGYQSGVVTIKADGQDDVTLAVAGYVVDDSKIYETFGALPEGWQNTGWTFSSGVATGNYSASTASKNSEMVTSAITVADGESLAIEAKGNGSYAELYVYTSADNGKTWNKVGDFNSQVRANTSDYTVLLLNSVAAGNYKLKFEGYSVAVKAINGYSYNAEAPELEVLPATAAAFGKVNAQPEDITYTVTNKGTGTLAVTIASDSEDFTVSPATLDNIGAGESKTFAVHFNFGEPYGEKAATITVTPDYDDAQSVSIAATATSKDPNVWEEDFQNGIPSTWTNNGWTISRKWNEDNSVNHAYSGTSDANTLITPRLLATEGQDLEFNVLGAEESYPLTVEYSNDLQSWKEYAKVTEEGTATFTAPADGNYYLRFSGRYIYLDDFSGFKLDLPAADAVITASTLPATGNQYVAYEASVTVQNKGTEAQTAVAKLIVDGEEKDSQETALAADATATLTLSFTPEVALDAVDAKIEVTLKDVEDFVAKTVEGTLTVNAATVIDEAATEQSFSEGTLPSVVLKYKAKNGWNTIGVPFALTNDYLTKIFGEGWKAYELTGYSDNEISFGQATKFFAGYPYIVYAQNAPESDGIVLTSVNIASVSEQEDYKDGLAFRSTYTPIAAGVKSDWWGVTNEGRIQPAGTGASLKGLRGYFYMNAEAPATNLNEARIVFINSDGTVTAINSIKSQFNTNGNTYDLSGRKMSGSLKQGVYIQNGKKIVVK